MILICRRQLTEVLWRAHCTEVHSPAPPVERERVMLSWSITFLVIALIAAVLGFGGIAGTAAGIAKILFVVFLVVFLLSLIGGFRRPV
jgi:uncharacterized membrane protein YtjA (UPF0391 family)